MKKNYFVSTSIITIIFIVGFSTRLASPTITTTAATLITENAALVGGNISNPDSENINDRGIFWKTTAGVTESDTQEMEGGMAAGSFTFTPTSFTNGVQIFYKAYVNTDESGNVLGDELSFYTLANEPTGNAGTISSSGVTTTTVSLTWTDEATADGYIILTQTGSTAPSASQLTDGTDPSIAGDFNADDSDGTPGSATGLLPATQYSFTVVPYKWNGSVNATRNYRTSDATSLTVTTACAYPVDQATAITFSNISGTQMDVSWTRGTPSGGDEVILIAREDNAVNQDPLDGDTYISNSVFPSGEDLGGGNRAVYQGAGTTVTITSLTAEKTYHFALFELNTLGPCYLLAGATASQCTPPSTQVSAFSVTSNDDTSIDLGWTSGSGDRRLILIKEGSAVDADPVDGATYTEDTSAPFTGSEIGTGNYVVHASGGSNETVTGLTPETTYHFRIYEYQNSTKCYNLNSPQITSVTTDCAFPSSQASSMSVDAFTGSTLDISWAIGNGDNRIVLAKEGSAVNADPVAGVTYTPDPSFMGGTEIGTGNYVVFAGAGTSETVTDLSQLTTYHFAVYEYFDASKCYNVSSPSVDNETTDCLQPAGQASSILFSNVLAATLTVDWTSSGTADGALVLVKEGTDPIDPTNGDDYAGMIDPSFSASNNDIQSGGGVTKALFRGAGTTVNVTGLSAATTYHFAIYEYNDLNICYNLTPVVSTQLTTSADVNSTITAGTGVTSFSSLDDSSGEWVDVFSFTVTDIGGDGSDIDISQMIFKPGGGNEIGSWDLVIADAKLKDDAGFDGDHDAAVIAAGQITIPNIDKDGGNPADNQLGEVFNGTAKVYTLSIYLENNLPTAIKQSIDGSHFVFSIHEDDITADLDESQFAPNETTDSDVVGGPNNEVTVVLEQIIFTTEPDPTTIFAGDNFSTPAVAEAQDSNGNRDLDYTGNNGVLFNVDRLDGLGTANEPASFSNGVLTFPGNFTLTDPTATTTKIQVIDIGASATTAQSVDIDVNTSNQSDIIASTTGFTYPQNIPYDIAANQGATVTGTSVKVMQLEIRDGGSTFSDADNLGTQLTDIELDLTDVDGVVNKVALFDDTNTLIQQQNAGSTIVFGSIGSAATTASDDDFKRISVRVTFNSTVTDNSQFSLQVSDATANTSLSTFAASDAGAAQSPTTGPDNQIEVLATKLIYTNQPPSFVRLGFNLGSTPVVVARDALDNLDEDFGELVSIENPDNITITNPSLTFSSGTLTFPGAFQYTAFTGGDPGDGTITVNGSVTDAVSNAVLVDGTDPIVDVQGIENITPAGPTDLLVKNGDIVSFTATFTENDQIDEITPPVISIPTTPPVNATMSKTSNTVWTYNWNVPTGNDGTGIPVTITATDRAGNPVAAPTGDVTFEIDNTDPTIDDITIVSNSTDPAYTTDPEWAKEGDDVTLTFTVNESLLSNPTVTIDGQAAAVTGSNPNYTGTYTLTNTNTEGTPLTFVIEYTDAAGNDGVDGTAVGGTGASTSVTFDKTAPALSVLLPDNNFLSIPVDADLKITLNDNLIPNINSTAEIRIKEFVGDAIFETFTDLANNTQITFSGTEVTINPTTNFATGTEYYVEIDGVVAGAGGDAIFDKAGNPYAGFIDNTTWKFQTFQKADVTDIVGNIDNSVCVETDITITGNYFAAFSQVGSATPGVTQVEFIEVTSGDIVLGTNIIVIDDNTLTVRVPANPPLGLDEDIQVRLTKNTEDTGIGINPTEVGDISVDIVAVGPATAEFDFAGDGTGLTVVCSDGISTSNILVNIFGGNGPYTVNYRVNDPNLDQGEPTLTVSNYNSGDFILVDPPDEGDNDYTIESVTDDNGCEVPVSGFTTRTITINQVDRSFVSIDLITSPSNPVCLVGLNTGDPITITGTITGTNQEVKWTAVNGTGVFSETGTNEYIFTSPDNSLTANYELTAQDLALPELFIKVESINSTAPCNETSDIIALSFTTSQSANLGGDQEICKTVSNPDVFLAGTLGGGSINGYWVAISTGPNPGADGTWQFGPGSVGTPLADDADGTTDGIMDNTYTMGPNDVLNGSVQIQLVPGGGTCGTPLDDIISVNIQQLPVPSPIANEFSAAPCIESTFVDYTVVNTIGSSYAWSIIPDPLIIPAPLSTDVGTVIAGQGTNKAFINWKDIPGDHQVEVIETNQFTCISNPIYFNVALQPLPPALFAQPLPGVRVFSKDAANIALIGVELPAISDPFPSEPGSRRDSLFFGPGVIVDENGNYFFDPDIAGSGSTHDVVYQYTDDYGCVSERVEQFSVFDASASIVLVDGDVDPNNDIVVADEYCEDFGVQHIRVSPTFPNATGFEFHEFIGPGITDIGDGTAFYDPLFAADPSGTGANRVGGAKVIEYTQHEIGNETNILPWGSQITDVNLIPPLANDPLPQSQVHLFPSGGVYCTNDDPIILTRDQSLNPLASYSFTVVGGEPHGLITQDPGPVFTLHPLNEFHPDSSYYDPDDFTAHIITIEYSYEYFYQPNDDDPGTTLSCNDITQFDVTIYQRPSAPSSDPVFGCEEGKTVDDLTVIDPVPSATVRWYDNPNLSGVSVQGATFQSNVTDLGTTLFYVTQEINGCESLATEVAVTVTTVNESDVSFTIGPACSDQDTQFNSFYNPADLIIGGTIEQWLWDFDDPNAIVGTEISTLENPTHNFDEAGTYNVSLTVTNNASCAATITNVIIVGEIPEPEFSFTAIAAEKTSEFRNETPALLSSTIIEARWIFEEWDGTQIHEEVITDPSLINEPYEYTFLTDGRKRATLTVTTDKNCINSITKEFFIVPFVLVTDVMFDFNSSAEGWISWGLNNPNSEWNLGQPTGVFDDGIDGAAWYTNPTDPAEGKSDIFSIVYSPCFDITNLVRPVVTLNTFTDTQNGAIIQYTEDFEKWETLGRVNSGINWYSVEDNVLEEFPENGKGVGWKTSSGTPTNELVWKESRHSLTDISTNRSQVIFRIMFRGKPSEGTGYAFDNFRIADRDRIVIMEHFENEVSTDPDKLKFINDYGNDANGDLNTTEIVKIQYRTGFGGDDNLFDDNSSDVNARALFYDVTSANRAMIDGDNSNSGFFEDFGATMFGTKSLKSPDLDFKSINVNQRTSGEVDVDITLRARIDIDDNDAETDDDVIITQAVIVENPAFDSKADTVQYVMIKMLPDAAGTASLAMAKDEEVTLPTVTWVPPKDLFGINDKYSLVVFSQYVNQNSGINEILQAAIIPLSLNLVTGIEELGGQNLLLFPNPTSEQLNLVFQTYEAKSIKIFDQFGKMIYNQDLMAGIQSYQVNTSEYASGVYFAQIESNENGVIRKKFILSH